MEQAKTGEQLSCGEISQTLKITVLRSSWAPETAYRLTWQRVPEDLSSQLSCYAEFRMPWGSVTDSRQQSTLSVLSLYFELHIKWNWLDGKVENCAPNWILHSSLNSVPFCQRDFKTMFLYDGLVEDLALLVVLNILFSLCLQVKKFKTKDMGYTSAYLQICICSLRGSCLVVRTHADLFAMG